MFIDFLSRAEAVFEKDARDLGELCAELDTGSAFVGFMPAVSFDLWPIYSLGCTRASRFTGSNAIPKIYVMPVNVYECYIYKQLKKIVRNFFADDGNTPEPQEKIKVNFLSAIFSKNKNVEVNADTLYGIEIEEIILLNHPDLVRSVPLVFSAGCECNSIYMRLTLPNGSTAYLFILCTSPEETWRGVIERFDIRVDMIIHSHKGFEHWFTSTPLYAHLVSTRYPHLLPKFYFRGKYITTDDAPPASTVADVIEDEQSNTETTIYRLPDKLK